jgi:hypothetical protein
MLGVEGRGVMGTQSDTRFSLFFTFHSCFLESLIPLLTPFHQLFFGFAFWFLSFIKSPVSHQSISTNLLTYLPTYFPN